MFPSLNITAAAIAMAALLTGFACESKAQFEVSAAPGVKLHVAMIGDSGISADPRTAILPLNTRGSDHLIPGALPGLKPENSLPKVFAPTKPRDTYTRYPWKRNIVTTVFWIGETPTRNNPTPNTVSAWDRRWTSNYGGFDNPAPSARDGYIPKDFTPTQNPFYYALPYNDITRSGTKASARAMIPWFKKRYYRSGRTVLKGQWMAIRRGDQVCYAQWEDVGPFETDDYNYIFGDERPKTKKNRGAGLDVSPAIRDYLGFGGGYGTVDWRFVDLDEVPDGPWKKWGTNNPFANSSMTENTEGSASESILKVRELRDRLVMATKEVTEPTESIE
ncbi:MAG: hypothetical protein P1U86_16530 [Verrucomicrobiales bacterium]|nr:hypothetical protein [Verrucomicrobiales bacterium]